MVFGRKSLRERLAQEPEFSLLGAAFDLPTPREMQRRQRRLDESDDHRRAASRPAEAARVPKRRVHVSVEQASGEQMEEIVVPRARATRAEQEPERKSQTVTHEEESVSSASEISMDDSESEVSIRYPSTPTPRRDRGAVQNRTAQNFHGRSRMSNTSSQRTEKIPSSAGSLRTKLSRRLRKKRPTTPDDSERPSPAQSKSHGSTISPWTMAGSPLQGIPQQPVYAYLSMPQHSYPTGQYGSTSHPLIVAATQNIPAHSQPIFAAPIPAQPHPVFPDPPASTLVQAKARDPPRRFSSELHQIQHHMDQTRDQLAQSPGDVELQQTMKALQSQLNETLNNATSQQASVPPLPPSPTTTTQLGRSKEDSSPKASPIFDGGKSGQAGDETSARDCLNGQSLPSTRYTREGSPGRIIHHHLCSGCGAIRSRLFHEKHPIVRGAKPLLNYCGPCQEVKIELGVADGRHHFCFGCGVVRSKNFHHKHPVLPAQPIRPNYCRRCRIELQGRGSNVDASVISSVCLLHHSIETAANRCRLSVLNVKPQASRT